MSSRAPYAMMSIAFLRADLSKNELKTLIALLSFYDSSNPARFPNPSVECIAERACISHLRHVMAATKSLQEKGIITRVNRGKKSSIYRMNEINEAWISAVCSEMQARKSKNRSRLNMTDSVTLSEKDNLTDSVMMEGVNMTDSVMMEGLNLTDSVRQKRPEYRKDQNIEKTRESAHAHPAPRPAAPKKPAQKKQPVDFSVLQASDESVKALIEHRKAMKKPLSNQFMVNAMAAQFSIARERHGASSDRLIKLILEHGWRGFSADWDTVQAALAPAQGVAAKPEPGKCIEVRRGLWLGPDGNHYPKPWTKTQMETWETDEVYRKCQEHEQNLSRGAGDDLLSGGAHVGYGF